MHDRRLRMRGPARRSRLLTFKTLSLRRHQLLLVTPALLPQRHVP